MSIPCIICHEQFNSDVNVIVLSCGHLYHGSCLEDWKRSSAENNSRPSCPVCRKTYDKRSIRKLYFNVEEPEMIEDLNNDLKRQKVMTESLAQHNERLQKELTQKSIENDKINQAWLQALGELNKIKTEYGIKCQAYSIIDTVNNEFLQDNLKLKDENMKLRTELDTIKQSSIQQQKQSQDDKIVDLCESDDEVQIVTENTSKSEVIEILDDDEQPTYSNTQQEKVLKNEPSNQAEKPTTESSSSSCDEQLKSAKKVVSDDYKIFEEFILSQI